MLFGVVTFMFLSSTMVSPSMHTRATPTCQKLYLEIRHAKKHTRACTSAPERRRCTRAQTLALAGRAAIHRAYAHAMSGLFASTAFSPAPVR